MLRALHKKRRTQKTCGEKYFHTKNPLHRVGGFICVRYNFRRRLSSKIASRKLSERKAHILCSLRGDVLSLVWHCLEYILLKAFKRREPQ